MRHVHVMAIGGAGMSTLAELLRASGQRVSGCDAQEAGVLAYLRDLGIDARVGHDPAHLAGVDELVVSTAIPPDHPEREAARAAGLPVTHRAQALARLAEGRRLVAVTGAHGKTTVTALVARVLEAGGLDPLVAVGFALSGRPTGARAGSGPWAVVEADESDGSFLAFHPDIAVVTNIEPDHLEHYRGSFDRLVDAYRRFLDQVRPGGAWVMGLDDPVARELFDRAEPGASGRAVIGYALHRAADWQAADVRLEGRTSSFVALYRGEPVAKVRLRVPGRHNVANALAALAVGRLSGVPAAVAARAVAGFSGARRRFEVVAEAGGVMVVDDYAHHPSEVAATLRAAREGYGRPVLAIFQPHRYHRTAFLGPELAAAFAQADRLILTEIYAPPPEQPLPGVSGRRLFDQVASRPEWQARPDRLAFCPTLDKAEAQALEWARPGTLILVMGAGDITRLAHRLGRAVVARGAP